MICSNCGENLGVTAKFCSNCGSKQVIDSPNPRVESNDNFYHEFHWSFGAKIVLNKNKMYVIPPTSLLKRFIAGDLITDYPEILLSDIKTLSLKEPSWGSLGILNIHLNNDRIIKYQFSDDDNQTSLKSAKAIIQNLKESLSLKIDENIFLNDKEETKEFNENTTLSKSSIELQNTPTTSTIEIKQKIKDFTKGISAFLFICLIVYSIFSDESKSNKLPVFTGTWYDDVGSPDYLDAYLTISKASDGRYTLKRVNGDNSLGYFSLEKQGNVFYVNNNKFGSFYVVRKNGLEIHDKRGYIRTARKVRD